MAAPDGDAEVIALGVAALSAAGLTGPGFDLTIDLGHLGLMREVLAALALPDDAAEKVRAAIAKRDRAALDEALSASLRGGARDLDTPIARFARALPDLCGDPTVLALAARQAPSGPIRRVVADLQGIVEAVEARGTGARLYVDLAEVRGFDYYTGVRFQGFVAGASDAGPAGRALRRPAGALRAAPPGGRVRRRRRGGRRRAGSRPPR